MYCHYPREVVRIPEPTEERVVLYLDGSGVEGKLPMAGAAAVRVRGVGQVTDSVVEKMVYGAASHGEVQAVADVVWEIGEEVREMWMVVDAEADMASLRRLASRPLHEALGTGLASQVYAIWHGLAMKKVALVMHLVKQESHRAGHRILRCRQIPKFSCRTTAETAAVAIFPPPQAFLAHFARFVPILCAVKQI